MNKIIKVGLTRKILVIGDVMLDHYIYGNCNRISPEAPVPVVDITHEEYMLGGAGNVVKNLHALGCDTAIYSVIGNDGPGSTLVERLRSCGAKDIGLVKDASRTTTIKSRVLVTNHQLVRLDRENKHAITADQEDQILLLLRETVDQYDMVLISDYNKGLLTKRLLENIFQICTSAGKKTLLDPKGTDFTKFKGVNIIKPNKKEAILATGIPITDAESLNAVCIKIKELTSCEDVVITLSEDGIALFTDNTLRVISTKAQSVIDVTGAGDTVLAAIGFALASGNTLFDSCEFANRAASIVVSKVGSATTTLEEINATYL